jgi:atypical dual specificity phosphatase
MDVSSHAIAKRVSSYGMIEGTGPVLQRFFWLIDGELAGSSRPGAAFAGKPSGTPESETLHQDLAWLREQGIGAVLSLTETPLPEHAVSTQGLAMLHLPVPDLCPPLPEEFMHALSFIDRQRLLGHAVNVHCLAGQGRTGTILAAYLIRRGLPPDAALQEVRARCPGAVGSNLQEQALRLFAQRRDWIL